MHVEIGEYRFRCVSVLGPWIISAHAKDITLRGKLSLHFDEVIPGQGGLDYATYLRSLDRSLPGVPLMLEHLKPEEYPEARDFVRRTGRSLGIDI